MKFNEKQFRIDAINGGWSDNQIETEIKRQRIRQTFLAKIVESPLIPAAGGLAGFAGGFVSPLTPVGGTAAGTAGGLTLQRILKEQMGLAEAPSRTGKIGEEFRGDVSKSLLAGALAYPAALGVKGIAGIAGLSPALRTIIKERAFTPSRALRALGEQTRLETQKAGYAPPEAFEKQFGTAVQPKPELTRGLTTAGEQGVSPLEPIVKGEIRGQGQWSPEWYEGYQPQPITWEDVLNWRQGAYQKGYEKLAPTAQRELWKRIGGGYSQLLKEYVPSIKPYDVAYSTIARPVSAAKQVLTLPNLLKAAFYAGIYRTARELMRRK